MLLICLACCVYFMLVSFDCGFSRLFCLLVSCCFDLFFFIGGVCLGVVWMLVRLFRMIAISFGFLLCLFVVGLLDFCML